MANVNAVFGGYALTHKNLAARKIIEAMRTAYAKKWDSVSTRLKQHMA